MNFSILNISLGNGMVGTALTVPRPCVPILITVPISFCFLCLCEDCDKKKQLLPLTTNYKIYFINIEKTKSKYLFIFVTYMYIVKIVLAQKK